MQYFNSIKVQLELPRTDVKSVDNYNFNSIKVQLEHTCVAVRPFSM